MGCVASPGGHAGSPFRALRTRPGHPGVASRAGDSGTQRVSQTGARRPSFHSTYLYRRWLYRQCGNVVFRVPARPCPGHVASLSFKASMGGAALLLVTIKDPPSRQTSRERGAGFRGERGSVPVGSPCSPLAPFH